MCTQDPGSLSAAVVTFRRPGSLARVLDSLLEQSALPRVVVIADNDPLRSAEPVVADERWAPLNLVYLPLGENTGPAGGWARAASELADRSDRGDWLLVIDDDDPLRDPRVLQRLLETTAAVLRPERCGAIGLRGATLDRQSGMLTRARSVEGQPVAVDYLASNGAPLYRWTAIDEVGFFDEDLFFGFEDLEEGLRLTAAGWDVWAVPLPSLHVVADTAPVRAAWREYFKARALVSICRRHVGWRAVLATVVRSVVLGGARLAVVELDWRLAEARVAGAIDGLRGRMGPSGRAPSANAPKSEAALVTDGLDLLFVSGVSIGGAARSTLELVAALERRGHRVRLVLGDRPAHGTPWDLVHRGVAKLRPRPGGAAVLRVFRRATRIRRHRHPSDRRPTTSRFPENAYLAALDDERPDAVIASSLPRSALQLMRDDLGARSIPLVLYLRESHALKHLEEWGVRPDLAIANSQHLATRAGATGVRCAVVPSAVDTQRATTTTSRAALLMVNPVRENRPGIALEIGRARPDIPVVIQESWPLDAQEWAALEAEAAGIPNVEVRRATSSSAEIYRDARLLLATYPTGRPRVVAEAQHNEIPAVALDQPGLAEAVADAGVLVAPDASLAGWLRAVTDVWDDQDRYEVLRRRCRVLAAAGETLPDHVAARFEEAVRQVIER